MKAHFERYFIKYSFWAVFGLFLFSWGYILQDQPDSLATLFKAENWGFIVEFLSEMAGLHEERPAYLDPEMWQNALWLSIETLLMSILATGIAAVAMLLFVLPAARNLAQGHFSPAPWGIRQLSYAISRTLFLFSRAVPELMWAMILVFIFKPGILPSALALAIHNFGVLGKLCSEVIEEMDDKPLRHLAQNGASYTQLLFYGIYPAVIRPFLNYILYRMENIIRATLIVGFVGASGLGMQFKLAMSFFHYSEITLYLLCYLLLVYLTDSFTALAQKWLVEKE